MRILLVNTFYYPTVIGGAEVATQLLAEQLVARGHQVAVASLTRERESPGFHQGVTTYHIRLRNLFWIFDAPTASLAARACWHLVDSYNVAMGRQVGLIADAFAPDIVHTNNLIGFSVAVWAEITKRGIPCVHTLHDYYLLCHRQVMSRSDRPCPRQCWDCRPFALPRRGMSRRIDGVVGVSRFTLDQHLAAGFFEETTFKAVIGNGTCLKRSGGEAERSREKIRFGFLGRLAPSKGLELLLYALNGFAADSWDLFVGGKGEAIYQDKLKAMWDRENIRFLGFVEPGEFLAQIDVLVVPSIWHETFGLVVIEAMTCGVPVIASKRGGIPELIDDGITGILFDPDSPDDLAQALGTFIANPALSRTMRPAVLRRSESFSAERFVSSYAELYQDVIAHKQLQSNSQAPGARQVSTGAVAEGIGKANAGGGI